MSKTLNTVAALTVLTCLGGCATGKDALVAQADDDRRLAEQEITDTIARRTRELTREEAEEVCLKQARENVAEYIKYVSDKAKKDSADFPPSLAVYLVGAMQRDCLIEMGFIKK